MAGGLSLVLATERQTLDRVNEAASGEKPFQSEREKDNTLLDIKSIADKYRSKHEHSITAVTSDGLDVTVDVENGTVTIGNRIRVDKNNNVTLLNSSGNQIPNSTNLKAYVAPAAEADPAAASLPDADLEAERKAAREKLAETKRNIESAVELAERKAREEAAKAVNQDVLDELKALRSELEGVKDENKELKADVAALGEQAGVANGGAAGLLKIPGTGLGSAKTGGGAEHGRVKVNVRSHGSSGGYYTNQAGSEGVNGQPIQFRVTEQDVRAVKAFQKNFGRKIAEGKFKFSEGDKIQGLLKMDVALGVLRNNHARWMTDEVRGTYLKGFVTDLPEDFRNTFSGATAQYEAGQITAEQYQEAIADQFENMRQNLPHKRDGRLPYPGYDEHVALGIAGKVLGINDKEFTQAVKLRDPSVFGQADRVLRMATLFSKTVDKVNRYGRALDGKYNDIIRNVEKLGDLGKLFGGK